ncbi:hypothetical protein JW868_00960 [Candidatus Woesearchaeota archaeon]|nr:hypothetical protein [Candidatus Woesearchaeota archaeon]
MESHESASNIELLEVTVAGLICQIERQYDFASARKALTEIGEKALHILMPYMMNKDNMLMPREDIAKAIGNIGGDKVLKELKRYLDEASPKDKAMALYALGETHNPNAVFVIADFLAENTGYDLYALQALRKIETPEARMVIENFGLQS